MNSTFTPPNRRRKITRRKGGKPVVAAKAVAASPEMMRIIRRNAVGNWMLPSLASVTPQYVETILRGAFGGNHIQQWELFDLMEDTWPRLLKNLGELKGAVTGMNWKLEAWADEDKPPTDTAIERKKLISDAIWQMRPAPDSDDNAFEQTVADILDAWAKGVSVLEILWEQRRVGQLGDLTVPNCTTWVHPRNYAWSEEGFLGLNPNQQINTGIFQRSSRGAVIERFPENKFLVAIAKAKSGTPITGARLRALAWWWCAQNFSADWLMNLAQLFGIPFRWATYQQGASDDTISEIGDLLTNMGSSGQAAFPEGTNLNFLEAGKNASSSPQADLLERADKNCDLIILGQTLTSDTGNSGAGGGSLALGKVHEGVREKIFQSAADFAARVLNQQLIPAILLENYGDTEEAPYFCPEPETQEDEKANADRDQVLLQAGMEIPKKWFYDRHGIPLPKDGEEVIVGRTAPQSFPGMPGNPAAGFPQEKPEAAEEGLEETQGEKTAEEIEARSALRASASTSKAEKFAIEVQAKVDPVLALLNRISNIKDDAAMLRAFQQLLDEADTIKALVTADVTRTQLALERITAPSLVRGLEGKKP